MNSTEITPHLLKQNYFEIFDLPLNFEIDNALLSERYRELQSAVHPDRFAHASSEEQRISVQQAAHINEAIATLKAPLARARYMLELKGVELNDIDTRMEPIFLMQQMELHEKLISAKTANDPFTVTADVASTLKKMKKGLITAITEHFLADSSERLLNARDDVRKLQFVEKLNHEVGQLEEELSDSY